MAARNPFASSVPDFYDPYALVQTRRPRHSTGYYFLRNLLLVGAVAGGLVAAYRNDVFRDLAQKIGQEQRYLDAEKFLVGSPGWGTPRSMEPVLKQAADAETGSVVATAPTSGADDTAAAPPTTGTTANAAPIAEAPAAAVPTQAAPAPEPVAAPRRAPDPEPVAAAAPAPAPRPAAAPAAPPHQAGSRDLSPVSLDSLPVLNRGTPVQAAALAPSRPTPAPAHVAVAAPVARTPVAAPAPRPAPVDRSHAKAIKVTLDEDEPAPAARSAPFVRHNAAPPPEPPPAPVAAKPEKPEPPKAKASDVHSGDNPLLAAVRGAVRSRPAKDAVPAAK